VFPSFQEGLPVALMEAMAVGLPVVCSKIRGNVDLIEHGINGFLVDPENSNDFARYIEKIISDETIQAEMSKKNLEYVKKYDKKNIRQNMIAIYNGATV
jgi:glycosyltransferase involved in cell wall biosynthesis